MQARQPALRLAVVLLLLASGAGAAAADTMGTPAPGDAVERILVSITRPSGDGPLEPARWAQTLTGHGYVTVMPDSFS